MRNMIGSVEPSSAQSLLQLRTTPSPGIRTSRRMQLGTLSIGKLTNKCQGRRIGRHLVTGLLQTTFHCCPKGRIVVNNVHKTLHDPSRKCSVASEYNLGDVKVPWRR